MSPADDERAFLDEPLAPVEPTARVFELLDEDAEQLQLFIDSLSNRIRALVPDLVGLSLTFVEDDVTFTVAASSLSLRALDAVQYLEDGPCEEALRQVAPVVNQTVDPLDESRWTLFALAGARRGVLSSLSLPLVAEGEVVGGVNLYGSRLGAFDDHVAAISALVGSEPVAAVRDADLSFSSYDRAVRTMHSVEGEMTIDVAVGILMQRRGGSADDGRRDLEAAAEQAGVPLVELALLVIELLDLPESGA